MKRKDSDEVFTDDMITVAVVAVIVIFFVMASWKTHEGSQTIAINNPDAVAPATPKTPPTSKYGLGVMETKGNSTWIPINLSDEKSGLHLTEVLGIINAFKQTHPDLEVTGWSLEKNQDDYCDEDRVIGIWVHHRKR